MRAISDVEPVFADLPVVLTVAEAASVLRISRSLAYELARRYLTTDGAAGLPVMRLGARLRVPSWAIVELARTGRVVQLADGVPSLGRHHGRAG